MIVREYHPADVDEITTIYKNQGFEYSMPTIDDSQFPVKRILSDSGNIAMAAFLRRTTEAFLLVDSRWRTPKWRLEAFHALHQDVNERARQAGIEDVQALLPPQVEKAFGKRLLKLGWRRNDWRCFSREVD